MQTSVESAEKWFQFPEKISFMVEVNGKKLTAALLSAIYHKIDGYLFRISFNDGHEDGYSIQDWKIYTIQDKSDPYCKGLEKEIHSPLFSWTESRPIACVNVEIDTEEMNAWIIGSGKSGPVPAFAVFIKNSEQLSIKKWGTEWKIEKTKGGYTIRKASLDKIKNAINGLLA